MRSATGVSVPGATASASRHLAFARAGIADLLRRYAPSGNRVLGIPANPEFLGWRAHLTVLNALQKGGRVVPIR